MQNWFFNILLSHFFCTMQIYVTNISSFGFVQSSKNILFDISAFHFSFMIVVWFWPLLDFNVYFAQNWSWLTLARYFFLGDLSLQIMDVKFWGVPRMYQKLRGVESVKLWMEIEKRFAFCIWIQLFSLFPCYSFLAKWR